MLNPNSTKGIRLDRLSGWVGWGVGTYWVRGGVNNNTKRVGWAVCKARGMVGVGNKAVQPTWSLSLVKSTNGPSGPGVQTVSRRYILME